jgi:hypothetical protein
VYRGVFRACFERFRQCVEKEKYMSRSRLDVNMACSRRNSWGRKDEEYIADFYLVSKRHLDSKEFRIFRFHYLLGADWRLCARRLNMDRGDFFHAVYRIQRRLGRVFRELRPYALFPLDEYFYGTTQQEEDALLRRSVVSIGAGKTIRRPLRPPLRPQESPEDKAA